ncbi:MlaD family protein [Hippea jasoniae]|uniref:MlaD family protein n=1 Tax=Hippea jasoniae TaxID=944479 RepID=UPI000550811B|nr:MlaD family protein [Hippea jasoniae]
MSSKKAEIVVGLFVLVILVVLGWLTTQMGKLQLKKTPTYRIYAVFNDVSGLDVNTKVTVAGVVVGRVAGITLKDGRAVVALDIYTRFKIPKDSIAIIKSKSLLGEKSLEIKYGNSNIFLKNGDYIAKTFSPTDLGTLITNINRVFNNQNRQNVAKALEKIAQLSAKLNDVVDENRKSIHMAIENFNKSMSTLAEILKENKKDVRVAVENARKAMQQLNNTLENLYFLSSNLKEGKGTLGKLLVNDSLYNHVDNASAYIEDITKKIDTGHGTLGKLVNDDEVYENLNDTLRSIKNYLTRGDQIALNIYAASQENFRDKYSKGYLYADIYTMPDKFYRIGVVDEKNYEHSAHPSRDDNDKIRFTALMGKRYYNFVIRAGIIESTFGGGLDYYAFNDKLKASLDAYDFNHNNDIRDKHAHMKFTLTYRFLRHFDLMGGVDEILNPRTRNVFAGMGVEFSSDDMKYLMTKAPSISPK